MSKINPTLVPVTCAATGIRLEACLCGACEKGAPSPARRREKHTANRRDAKAMLDVVVGFLDKSEMATASDPTWAQANGMATVRDRMKSLLLELALMTASSGASEDEIKAEIEWALLEQDGEVVDALIDAL